MLRVLKYLGLALAGLVLLLLAAVFILPKTGPGQALLDNIARPAIENAVDAQLASEIEFDRIHGALPGELILENVRLSQEGEVWLEVDRIALDWSPLALIRRHIKVRRLEGSTITLYQRPDLPEREEKEAEKAPSPGGLSLPWIQVDEFNIETVSIREPVFGRRYDLSIRASAEAEGRGFDVNANIDTVDDSDQLRANFAFDGRVLTLDASVLSAPTGLITTAAKAEDTIWLALEGNGPLEDWQGTLEAQAGNYGGIAGQLGGDLRSYRDASFAFDIAPGPLLPEISEKLAGDSLHIAGTTTRQDDLITLAIEDMSARFGELSGTVSFPPEDLDRLTADISGRLSEELAADYSIERLAGPVDLEADITRSDDTIDIDGRLETVVGALTVEDGVKRPGTYFEGRVALDASTLPIENERFGELLDRGAVIRTQLKVTEDLAITADDLDAILGRDTYTVSLGGNAAYNVSSKSFNGELGGSMGPDASALLLGQKVFEAPVTYTLRADGTANDTEAVVSAQFPAGMIDDQGFTAGTLRADMKGLPSAPRGKATIIAKDESYRGEVLLTSTTEAINISELTFTGGSLNVTGNGSYRRDSGAATADLTVAAPEGTTLITGHRLAGRLDLEGEYGGKDGAIDLTATANELAFDAISIKSANVRAQGPMSAVNFSASGQDAALPSVYLAAFDTQGTADLKSDTRRIDLSALMLAIDADTEESRITLTQPTRITLGEAITLSPTSLDWLKDGTVNASATYGKTRWVADVKLEDVSVPGLYAPLSGSITLDTDLERPATFDLSSSVTPEDSDTAYQLNAEGFWTGTDVSANANFREEGADPLMTADLTWPVRLVRQGGNLSVELPDDSVSGTVIADGEIDPIYAFLPAVPPYLTGQLDGRLTLTGTAHSPGAEGSLSLSDGRFEDGTVGVVLTELQGTIDAAYDGNGFDATVDMTGSGADGRKDAVNIQGTFELTEGTSAIDTKLVLNDATIVDGPNLKVRTGADLTLSGSLDELTLAGTVDIGQVDAAIPGSTGNGDNGATKTYTEVNVVRVDAPEEETPDVEEVKSSGMVIALDLEIVANNEIYIRGRGLDSEWSANLDIEGTTADPVIDGQISNRRGTFEFAGRDFDIDRGRVNFERTDPALARLDVRASYDADDLTAFVNVTGDVADPKIELSSTPVMPQEDIMAIILFGKQPTELSALESLQIANALRSLAGIGPSFGGGGTGLQSALGLDALSFGIDDDTGEGVVAVGKYLSDDVYVSARQSAGGTSSEITVTYEVTDDITVESTLEPNGTQDVSVNYKRDY